MIQQGSLFDPVGADRARADGIATAEANMNPRWAVDALEAVRYVAAQLPDFTADDVIIRLQKLNRSPDGNPSALGPVFLRAARHGEIEKTGTTRRSVIARRHRDLTVWRATFYDAPVPRSDELAP